MGNRRRLREAFFASHPVCCFCGGSTRATEEDHIPARSLFRRREWPVGYVFPSCSPCNRDSADDELAMAWLVRVSISNPDEVGEREMEHCLAQLNDRKPSWIAGMKELSRVETRRHLRERGLSLESFRGHDIGVMAIPAELMEVPERYGVKLGKALFYLHTGRVLPSVGMVRVAVFANTTFMAEAFPRASFDILSDQPTVARSGRSLADQFFYRFATVREGGGAGFLVQFGESTAMLLLAVEDAKAYAARHAERLASKDS